MSNVIDKKIVGYALMKKEEVQAQPVPPAAVNPIIHMHEQLERPSELEGKTYKVKNPSIESALYITINDLVLNAGTTHEHRRPYEIFINTRETKSYQWVIALSLLMSAVFRKGGDTAFLIEEMRSVFDPQGGYFSEGKYVPSLIADIGNVIERHFISIGLIKKDVVTVVTKREVTEEDKNNAAICHKCNSKTLVLMDGCETCLSCGYSKCG